MKIYLLAPLVPILAALTSCTTSEQSIGVESSLGQFYTRAQEPAAIAGEKDERMILDALENLNKEGDRKFNDQIAALTNEQRSALRIFFSPQMLGWSHTSGASATFPKTATSIATSERRMDWPALIATRRAMGDPALELDEWPP